MGVAGFEIELLGRILGCLQRLERTTEANQHLLREMLARLPLETYHPTIGGTVTVTET
jgi:hypothetical protein